MVHLLRLNSDLTAHKRVVSVAVSSMVKTGA